MGARAEQDIHLGASALTVGALDLKEIGVRGVNERLHGLPDGTNEQNWTINNPKGQHAIACGLDAPLDVTINGHVGFYCAGMNQQAMA